MGQRGEATPGRCYCDLHAVLLCFTGRDIVFHVAAAGEEADLSRARPRVPRRNIPTRVGRIVIFQENLNARAIKFGIPSKTARIIPQLAPIDQLSKNNLFSSDRSIRALAIATKAMTSS